MVIEKIKISKLKPAGYNPRKDLKPGDPEYEKLKRSFQEFGYVEPVVYNKRTGNVVGGHQRLKILAEMGEEEIECVVVDLPDDREKALNIALNRIQGDWDSQRLNDLLNELNTGGLDISITGFDTSELDALMRQFGKTEEDDFDVEKALEEISEPVTKPGDIWRLGRHRLMCGDSTIEADVQKLMDGQKAKLIVTDAPYNVNLNNNGNENHPSWKKRGGILGDNMPRDAFKVFLTKAFTNAYRVAEAGAAIFAFMSAQEWPTIDSSLRDIGWHWSSTIIWVKDSLVLGRKSWQPRYEAIWFGWPEGTKMLYPLKEDRTQTDVWEFDRPKRSPLHPTQKPLELISKPIYHCSREGDIVLDLFAGSGTVLISSDQLRRIAYLQELDLKFCDVIVKRYAEYKGGEDDVFLLRSGQIIRGYTSNLA